jgi:hypothetical protein
MPASANERWHASVLALGSGLVASSVRAAASVDAAHWLNVGLLVNGRYDRHGSDEQGRADGLLFQSRLSARTAPR